MRAWTHNKHMEIRDFGKKYSDYVIAMRRQFHAMPELSLQEYKTCAKIIEELGKIGITGEVIAETGVIAAIKGGKPGKRVALRADIDALGVTEQTGAEYASRHPGVMHACGHDAHIAMLLGAARILYDIKDELAGEVRLMFEPAEEIAKGAKR